MRRLAVLALPLTLPLSMLLAACQGERRTTVSTETQVDGRTTASVEATDAWCRPTPNGRDVTACYITLTASVDDRLVSALSPRAGQTQIHTMAMENGMMTMQELPDGLPLPAGQTVSLAPGGDHLMLLGVTVPLAEGDRVPLALTFQSGAQIALEAPVQTAPLEGEAPAPHSGGH